MGIVMLMIFLITDLSVVLICKYAYAKRDRYAEGMLMGVHIPAEEVENEEVQKICRESKRIWNRFHWGNLIFGCLLCGLCFYSLEIFLVVWVLWIFVYMAVTYYLVIRPHRQMYRLKLRNHWVNADNLHKVCIDTELSSMSGQMAYDWKWHLPVLIFILASGVALFRSGSWFTQDHTGEILFGCALLPTLVFIGFHIWISGRQNVVYSQNTKINIAVNQIVKRAWSGGTLAADYLNGISWLFFVIRLFQNHWLSGWDYAVFAFLQILAAGGLLIPLLFIRKKKQRILEQDTEPVWVDDDEYWKNGWYCNPNDSRLMVQDRLCGMNYSFNMARPASWVIYGVAGLVLAGTLFWTGKIMLEFRFAKVEFSMEVSEAEFEAAGYRCSFALEDVEAVELLDQLPDEGFVKTNGGAADDYRIGHFRGSKSGKCMMFLRGEHTPLLKVVLPDMVVFANSERDGEVQEWYEALQGETSSVMSSSGGSSFLKKR